MYKTALTAVVGVVALSGGTLAHADHLSGGLGLETAAPIITDSAVPLAAGGWSFGLRFDYTDFDEFSDQELIRLRGEDPEGDIHSIGSLTRYSLLAAYGVNDNLTLGARLPWVSRDDVKEPEEGHCHDGDCVAHDIIDHGDVSGIGDLLVFGLYRLLHAPATHTHLSAILGIKTPTGETHETGFESEHDSGISVPIPATDEEAGHTHEGNRLETHLQPGSGSWDALLGLAYQTGLGLFTFNASLVYTVTTEGAQDTELGDIFDYNVALSYPLPPGRFAPCASCSWNLMLELNGEWQSKEETDGMDNDNSGGHVLFLSPGVRFNGGRWSLGLSAGYPLVTDLNGEQVDPDFRVLATAGLNF